VDGQFALNDITDKLEMYFIYALSKANMEQVHKIVEAEPTSNYQLAKKMFSMELLNSGKTTVLLATMDKLKRRTILSTITGSRPMMPRQSL
jgi:hypothetical protein